MTTPTQKQIEALFELLRKDADASGYGWAMSDDKLQVLSVAGATVVVNAAPPPKPAA